MQNLIASSKLATLSLTILLLFIGMATAALINYISVSPVFSKSFYLGATIAIVMILLGIILFAPFFNFRFKYLFLEQNEEAMGKQIYFMKLKSENWVNSIDGIIGIRLIKVEKHTKHKEVLFTFKSIFDAHSKYTKLNKIKPNIIKKNIELDEWIATHFKNLDENAFSNTNMPKTNKIMSQILIAYLDDYSLKNFNEDQKNELKEIAKKWKRTFPVKKVFKSIHYTTIFKDKKSYTVFVSEKKGVVLQEKKISDKFVYWEDYGSNYFKDNQSELQEKDSIKFNRRYYNLHLRLKNELEGVNDYILQVIIDRRLILSEEVVYDFMQNVIK